MWKCSSGVCFSDVCTTEISYAPFEFVLDLVEQRTETNGAHYSALKSFTGFWPLLLDMGCNEPLTFSSLLLLNMQWYFNSDLICWLRRAAGGKARKKAPIILFSHQIYSDVYLHCFLFGSFRKFPCQNLRNRVGRIISASQHFQFSRQPVELLGHSIEQWCPKATSGNRKGVNNSWTNNCLLNLPLILCMLSSLWWKQQQFASLGLLIASQQVAFCSFLYLTIYLFWRDSASHMLNKAADNL